MQSQITSQMDSFNQINMNMIKNTKLFQKFIQNKTNSINNNNSTINNKSLTNDHQINQNKTIQNKPNIPKQTKQPKQFSKQTNKNNTNLNNRSYQQQIVQEDKQIPNKNQYQNITHKNSKTKFQYPYQYNNNYQIHQHFYVQPYQKQLNQPYQTYQTRQQQNKYNQKSQVSNQQNYQIKQTIQIKQTTQNKRKRNFNPTYMESARNQTYQQKQLNINKPLQNNLNEESFESINHNKMQYQQAQNTNNFITHNYSQKNKYKQINSLQNNFNYQNTRHQSDQYKKIQSSPQRNTNFNNFINQQSNLSQNSSFNPNKNISNINNNTSALHNQHQNQAQTSISYSEPQYRIKYQNLLKKHEQLKLQLKNQNKNRKIQFSQYEHEIQMLKQKLFDVQSRQDSLLIQNQRLKQKCQSQSLLKMKTQQENKQLAFRIKQLQDQISMKQNNMKQRYDQNNYWKSQIDSLKQQLNTTKLTLQKRNDQYSILYGDYQIIKKQRANKDYLLQELRKNIGSLVQQNSAAKDQIFKLVTKLYQLQQQNQILRNDLKRQQFDQSQLNQYMKQLQQQTSNISRQRVQSSYIEKTPYEPLKAKDSINRNESSIQRQMNNRSLLIQQEKPNMQKPNRRRGQFARERGQIGRNQKPQRDERPLPNRNNFQNNPSTQQKYMNQQSKPVHMNNNKGARIQQICQQLQKIKDLKAMNGAIRRKKIDLERQLQELQSQ